MKVENTGADDESVYADVEAFVKNEINARYPSHE